MFLCIRLQPCVPISCEVCPMAVKFSELFLKERPLVIHYSLGPCSPAFQELQRKSMLAMVVSCQKTFEKVTVH